MSLQTQGPATYADLVAAPREVIAEIMGGRLVTRRFFGPWDGYAHTQLLFWLNYRQSETWHPDALFFCNRPELHLGNNVIVPEIGMWTVREFEGAEDWIEFTVRPRWVCEFMTRWTDLDAHHHRSKIMADAGIPRMWRLDTTQMKLDSFELTTAQTWKLQRTFTQGDVVEDPLFPNIAFSFDELWR